MKKSSKQIIGRQLRELRNQYKLTARDIAIRCHIAHPNLLNIENGKQNTSLGTLEKLANAYGMEVTLTKKQYGIKIDKKQVSLLKEIEKAGYILSNKTNEDGKAIAYKPSYRVIYWHSDEATPEVIGEYDKVSKARAKLPTVGNSKSSEYYEPTSELLVIFIEGYINKDGNFVDSNVFVLPSELKGCMVSIDNTIGCYNHQPRYNIVDNAFSALSVKTEKYIIKKLSGEKFYCKDEKKFIKLDCSLYSYTSNKQINITAENEVIGTINIILNRNRDKFELAVKYGKKGIQNTFNILDTDPTIIEEAIRKNIEILLHNNI